MWHLKRISQPIRLMYIHWHYWLSYIYICRREIMCLHYMISIWKPHAWDYAGQASCISKCLNKHMGIVQRPWEPGNRTVFQFKRIKPLGEHSVSYLLALQLLFKPRACSRKSFSQSRLLWWQHAWRGRKPYKVMEAIISAGSSPYPRVARSWIQPTMDQKYIFKLYLYWTCTGSFLIVP